MTDSFFMVDHKHLGELKNIFQQIIGVGIEYSRILTKCQVLNGGENHHGGEKTPPKKRPLSESLLVWAGVRTLFKS